MDFAVIARRWIFANAISLAIGVTFALAIFGVRTAIGIGSSETAITGRIAYWVIAIALDVINFSIYALLLGSVLRLIVPTLPQRLWLASHVIMGLLFGIGLALLTDEGDSDPIDWSEVTTGAAIFVASVFAVGGALLGAAFGGPQAMVLRRVASGTRMWIGMAAVSGITLSLIVLAAFPFFPSERTLRGELVTLGAFALGCMVSTFIMLPALRRLRPRS